MKESRYSVLQCKRAGGETFQFLYICPVSALRSTIGILTIRPIKEIIQWHFGVAACCLSQPGSGGDTCTFLARMSPLYPVSFNVRSIEEGEYEMV